MPFRTGTVTTTTDTPSGSSTPVEAGAMEGDMVEEVVVVVEEEEEEVEEEENHLEEREAGETLGVPECSGDRTTGSSCQVRDDCSCLALGLTRFGSQLSIMSTKMSSITNLDKNNISK